MVLGKDRKQVSSDFLSSPPPVPTNSFSQPTNKKDKVDLIKVCFIFLLTIFFIIGYRCPMYYVMHIHCPGCGMTRAAISLLKGDLSSSLSFHALLLPTLILALLYLIVNKKNSYVGMFLIWVWIILMGFYWIYRLLFVFPNVSW